ncbi:MAG: hypothetical protein ACXVJO_13640 [Thermoanaerobaculia bacterium]
MKKKTEAGQLSLSGTDEGEILARLSERVEKAVAMIGELRRERDALKKRLEDAELGSAERLLQLEGERSEIRNRIESILSTLESLETTEE